MQEIQFDSLRAKLMAFGQEHLLFGWDQLPATAKERLVRQIESIDFEVIRALARGEKGAVDLSKQAYRATPPPAVRPQSLPLSKRQEANRVGSEAIACGRLGAILVAGGQGTRLGFDQPKGMYRIGPLSGRSLFEMHVDRLIAVMNRYDVSIPLYIMTSPATDLATRTFFEQNDRFGLDRDQLIIFCQGMMPAVDSVQGKILLSHPGEIALSPDGHGGLLSALEREGCLQHAADRGIESFFYAQVDNPLVPFCDPELIGYHKLHQSQMTTQVVQKRFAKEKVGNVVTIDEHVAIIEYSDLPDDVAGQTNEDGSLRLWAGNIAVHIIERAFLEEVKGNAGLPFHKALKSVATIDADGNSIVPSSPNAIKFEKFIFDLLPMARQAIVVEGDPLEVFAPVKNADSAPTDTPSTAREAICRLHQKWLERSGAQVAEGVRVEINPRWALDEQEVAAKIQSNLVVSSDTYFSR